MSILVVLPRCLPCIAEIGPSHTSIINNQLQLIVMAMEYHYSLEEAVKNNAAYVIIKDCGFEKFPPELLKLKIFKMLRLLVPSFVTILFSNRSLSRRFFSSSVIQGWSSGFDLLNTNQGRIHIKPTIPKIT